MSIGKRILELRAKNNFTQEQLAEKLDVSRQSISKWEIGTSVPEIDNVIAMSKLFSVETDQILLDESDIKKTRPQVLHLGSVYLVVRDFEKGISFYEKLLSIKVTSRNCGSKFSQFFFDNNCLALMNETNIENHQYTDGDYKFVLNFWVEDLEREHKRLKALNIGEMTDIVRAHDGYYYFHVLMLIVMLLRLQVNIKSMRRNKMNTICQSCGMYIVDSKHRGTNTDKNPNEDYCIYCYQNGAFLLNDTMEQKIEKCIEFHVDENTNEKAAREKLLKDFPKLKRWRKV